MRQCSMKYTVQNGSAFHINASLAWCHMKKKHQKTISEPHLNHKTTSWFHSLWWNVYTTRKYLFPRSFHPFFPSLYHTSFSYQSYQSVDAWCPISLWHGFHNHNFDNQVFDLNPCQLCWFVYYINSYILWQRKCFSWPNCESPGRRGWLGRSLIV